MAPVPFRTYALAIKAQHQAKQAWLEAARVGRPFCVYLR